MQDNQTSTAEPLDSGSGNGVEIPPRFIPTPERLSQYLEVNVQEVLAQLESVDGREKLYQDLIEHEEELRTLDPEFHPTELKEQLDLVAETLQQKQVFLEDVHSPEKKGVFKRAWEKVKGFTKKHPIVTVILVLALVASGVAGSAYLAGGMEALLAKVGMSHLYGAEGAAKAAETLGEIIEGGKGLPNYFDGPASPDLL